MEAVRGGRREGLAAPWWKQEEAWTALCLAVYMVAPEKQTTIKYRH